jgi:hypothetical protein
MFSSVLERSSAKQAVGTPASLNLVIAGFVVVYQGSSGTSLFRHSDACDPEQDQRRSLDFLGRDLDS